MSKDLQSFLNKVEKQYPQNLLTIEKEVDPLSFEISGIIKHLIDQNSHPIVLFMNTKNVNRNKSYFPVVDNVFATRELCALGLDLPPERSDMSLGLEFSKREAQKIEPIVINKNDAPVKEVIKLNKEVDVRDLPAARYHEMDLGPYLTMVNIMKGEDGNFYDVSFCKNMIIDSKTLTVSLHHTIRKHLLYILEGNDAKDLPTPIIIVLGHHPAFYLGAGAIKEFGNNDYETIGAFLQEPLRLTPSETWGEKFLVPADAEIIIEGEVIPRREKSRIPLENIPATISHNV